MKIIINIIFTFVSLVGIASTPGTPSQIPHTMEQLLSIRAENGEVSFEGNAVSMYSSKSIATRGGDEKKWKYYESNKGGISVALQSSRWSLLPKPLSGRSASSPWLEDWWNQIDIASSNSEIAALIPGARIKMIHEEDSVCIVVYSKSSDQARYDLEVALLKKTEAGQYALSGHADLGENGYFAGMVFLKDGRHFVVLVDEPSSSSNFLVSHVFFLQ